MKKSNLGRAALAVIFSLSLSAGVLADTIRLRDGSVVRGQIIAFKDQQFTVLIGAGARGMPAPFIRRSGLSKTA
jgi:hypothetical protein